MRRHVVRMSGSGRNLSVHARRRKALFGENRIVVAMDDVMRDAGMMRPLLENRFEDFAAAALIREGLVRFGSGDGKSEGVKNGSFVIVGISSLQYGHPLFESTVIGSGVLSILGIHGREGVDVGFFAI